MKLAQIENGVLVNIIVVDPDAIPAWAQTWPNAEGASIGWLVSNDGFIPPPEPTPEELRAQMPRKSMVELRAALRAIRTPTVPDGIYSDDIYAKIDLIADRDLREEAKDFFDHGQYAERVNPWVDILGAMFGLSPEDIDDMWQAAISI